jgi:hypothetical protein
VRVRYAAAAGAAAVATAIGFFLFLPHHMVAGTNKVAPLAPVVHQKPGTRVCTQVDDLPAEAGTVRVRIASERSSVLRVLIADARGRIGAGTAEDAGSGNVSVPLSRPTRATPKARLCILNLTRKAFTLYGESPVRGGTPRPTPGIAFLDADSSNWFSHLGEIETGYGYSHVGAIGSWGVWAAGILAAAASLLALGLICRKTSER